jgi:hypothetical protein
VICGQYVNVFASSNTMLSMTMLLLTGPVTIKAMIHTHTYMLVVKGSPNTLIYNPFFCGVIVYFNSYYVICIHF